MTDAAILTMLKSNLQILTSAYDTYLGQLVTAAKKEIMREGITLPSLADDYEDTDEGMTEIDDANLIVMYAAYLYRKRADDNPVMPRMLRYALNNRLFSQKAGES